MTESSIRWTLDGRVARVTIDAPARRNALRSSDWTALAEAISQADANDLTSVIVVRGAQGHFGAGADVVELARILSSDGGGRDYFERMEKAMSAIESAAKPVIAVIEGNCFGGCVAIALACDIRVAHSEAVFAITPAKLGIIYPYGDIQRLVRSVGAGQAKRLIYSGGTINAGEALTIGLVEQIADNEHFEASVDRLIDTIAKRSSWTIKCSKVMIHEALLGNSFSKSHYLEMLDATLEGRDLSEGLSAFRDKRAAAFNQQASS